MLFNINMLEILFIIFILQENLNQVYGELMSLHLHPCKHEFDELMETDGIIFPPNNFNW